MVWINLRYALRQKLVPIIVRSWPLTRLWYRAWGMKLAGGPEDPVWYFAYGSNLHDSAFLGWRAMRPSEWRVGRIAGFRLRFNLGGRPKGWSTPANVSRDEDAEVWGVLYRINRRELVRLNASEGVPGRGYSPLMLAVQDSEGNAIDAVVYVADGGEEDSQPSLRYMTLLREGARAHGLPGHWVAYLESVDHRDDHGEDHMA